MRKIKKLTILLFLITSVLSAQNFAKHYNKFIKLEDKEVTSKSLSLDKWVKVNLIVIFSGDSSGDIMFCYDLFGSTNITSVKIERYYKVSGILKDQVNSDNRYIYVINENGSRIEIQLFDNGILKVHHRDYVLEYK